MVDFLRKARLLLPSLLAVTMLRAMVPAGYMPAPPDSGLFLVLCHEMLSPILEAASASHAEHPQHHGGSEPAAESCSFGHILSFAFIDDPVPPGAVVDGPAGYETAATVHGYVAARLSAYAPRGPPFV